MATRTFIGNEVASSKELTQVYMATHKGEEYLPFMNRSFISFSFGGKNIEDFGLIAVTDGDRMQLNGSSNFNNMTTEYEVVNGQLYWGTQFQGNTLNLTLATDGITQRQLDDFLMWFRGGETRELILAQHPNRAIFARVAEPPSLSILPFEKHESVKIANNTFTTSTTLYRGNINLQFQMDEPFWYAKENIFGYFDEDRQIYVDEWVDANGNTINIFDDARNKDAVKIALEDGIPFSSMIQDNMLLGNNIVANTNLSGGAIIAEDSFKLRFSRTEDKNEDFYVSYYAMTLQIGQDGEEYMFENEPQFSLLFNDELTDFSGNSIIQAKCEEAFNKLMNDTMTVDAIKSYVNLLQDFPQNATAPYDTDVWMDPDPMAQAAANDNDNSHAKVTGVYMTSNTGITSLPYSDSAHAIYYFYYAGTAPAYPTVEFILTPLINQDGYIQVPANSFSSPPVLNDKKYNSFFIESENKYEFKFTTPNIYTSFNTAISLFKANDNKSNDDVREIMQENVKHYAVRAWAMRILDYMSTINADEACLLMSYIFKDVEIDDGNAQVTNLSSTKFSFDSKTGLAYGTFKFRDCTGAGAPTQWTTYCTGSKFIEKTENVGDMIKSDWLVIKERNTPDSSHLIRAWTDSISDGKKYSYKIYHDVINGLQNVKLIYNNMYV